MSIIRVEKNRNYSVIANQALRDERLSFRARGIFAFLMSQPDNWSVRSDALSHNAKEGRDAIRAALNELEECGYLQRKKYQDSNGHWKTDTVLCETPLKNDGFPVTEDGFPGVGSPVVGKPGPLYNNYVTSTINKNIAQDQNDSATLHHSGLRQPKAPKASKTSLSSVKEVLGVEGAKPPHTPSSENPLSPPSAAAWDTYLGKLAEYEGSAAINFARERKGINTLVKLGWTAEQIGQCFDLLKADDFWAKKHLSAQSIGNQIGAKLSQAKAKRSIGLNEFQTWLYKNHGVTDLETAAIISGKTEQELRDDYECFA